MITGSFQTEAITVLLSWNFSKMFKTWKFCFVEDNKIISGIKYTITELGGFKKDLQHTSGRHAM